MKTTGLLLLLGLLCPIPPEPASAEAETEAARSVDTESAIFTMDRVYPSMFGPKDTDRLELLKTPKPEVLWITAIKAEMVAADGETPESPEYFCHSVLTRVSPRPVSFLKRLGLSVQNPKMFTLVQGLAEIRFPDGYGMPVLSNDRFHSTVMVMNPMDREEPVHVGVDSRIEFLRQSELDREMKPLFLVPLVTKVPVEGSHDQHDDHPPHPDGESCLDADAHTTAARSVDRTTGHGKSPVTVSDTGREVTGHWYVPPGRHVYRHRLGPLDDRIRFDTKAHYIASHLHPFGESLELIDLTTGESVFKATASNYPDRVAVQEITHFSSEEGLAIDRHHEHEIVAVYNNTTDHNVDSMAVMYLYLHDNLRSRATASREAPGS
jgi:hypothetical protein